MEKSNYKGDFEKLLKSYTDQYKMYPSKRVWEGIHSSLHPGPGRKWIVYSGLILFIISTSIVSVLYFSKKAGQMTASYETAQTKKSVSGNILNLPPVPADPVGTVPVLTIKAAEITPERMNGITTASVTLQQERLRNRSEYLELIGTEYLSASFKMRNRNPETPVVPGYQYFKNSGEMRSDQFSNLQDPGFRHEPVEFRSLPEERPGLSLQKKLTEEKVMALASQEMKLNPPLRLPRLTAQVYLTPTVSYRKLTENKNSTPNAFGYAQIININSVVNHKPAMGFEFGIEGKYRLNENLSIKSGLQFNINRYDIRAYYHPTEIATVAVRSGFRTDSLASLSNYRNFSGYSTNWLENFYFQAALPVGAEIILGNYKNTSWGVSGTIQPTYNIGDRAYLISSDYKNYATFPNLMRRWNVSSSVELFANYSTGRIHWQTGPHVRYQHLSSFVTGYPVKENLFAVGLKVAATLNKKK